MNIALCMPVRDCGKYLEKIFSNIDKLKEKCNNITFYEIYVYNDCLDNTEELILQRKKENKNIIIREITNNHIYRTCRISLARNTILDIIYKKLKNIDYHIMIDADDMCAHEWDYDIICNYLNNYDNDDWDCITFNRNHYYDIWALLIDSYDIQCYHYLLDHTSDINRFTNIVVLLMRIYVNNKLSKTNNNSIEVISAFNGFAIYKTNKYKNIYYDGYNKSMFLKNYVNKKKLSNYLNYVNKVIANIMNIDTFENIKINTDLNNVSNTIDRLNNVFDDLFYSQCGEHIFYNLMAKEKNNCKIKISKFKAVIDT